MRLTAERRVRTILEADDRTRPGLDSANQRMESLNRSAARVALTFGTMSAAGIAAISLLTRDSLKMIDSQAKAADQLGMTSEGFSIYSLAAEDANVASNTLSGAILRMNNLVADAARGNSKASETIQKLGLDLNVLRNQGPEATFQAILAQLNQIPDSYERSRLASEAFGRGNTAVLNITAEGLRSARDFAEDFNLAISRTDAAKVEAANNALLNTRRIATSIGHTFAIAVAPEIERGANALAQFTKEHDAIGRLETGLRNVSVVMQNINRELKTDEFQRFLEFLASARGGMWWLYETFPNPLQATVDMFTGVGQRLTNQAGVRFPVPPRPAAAGPQDLGEQEAAAEVQALQDIYGLRTWLMTEQNRQREEYGRLTLDRLQRERSEEERALLGQHELRMWLMEEQNRQREEQGALTLERIRREKEEEIAAQLAIVEMRRNAANATMGILQMLQSSAMQQSRAGFRVSQLAAISETTVNTYKAATGAYSALASIPIIGPALGVAAAAAATAAGMANVNAIKSQQFGSGTVSGMSYGNPGTATNPVVTQPLPQQNGPTQVQVIVQGDIVDYQQWTENTLAPVIRDAVGRQIDFGLEVQRG